MSEILELYTSCFNVTSEDTKKAINILQEIVDYHSHAELDIEDYLEDDITDVDRLQSDASEIFDAIVEIESKLSENDDDFMLEFDGAEYRIMHEDTIWDTYVNEIQHIVQDCYDLNFDNIPSFVSFSINWQETAENAFIDGYGHTFSGYDGSELECENFYIFRTN